WDFGDGTNGTGDTATHTYADDGEFDVTLTVTDNQGATNTVTQTVNAATTPNQAPTAAFTATVNQLEVAFNASDSTDPDGTITEYAWDFGDGTNGTGDTATHTYTDDGTYDVVLTVTDDAGGTDMTALAVTVAELSFIAADTFDRTLSNSWGAADVGGVWTRTGSATNFAVSAGVGSMRMATGSGPGSYLDSVSIRDTELQASVSYDKPASGGGIYSSFIVRRDGNSDYRAVLRSTATGMTLQIQRKINGATAVLGSTVPLPGGALAADEGVLVKIRAVGEGSTTVQAKAWRANESEPEDWMVTTTDSSPQMQNAGSVGLYSYLSGSATNGPISARFSDFKVMPA
ncbi:MAG: PKD domain-containing protein, partial [Arachnia sp.]